MCGSSVQSENSWLHFKKQQQSIFLQQACLVLLFLYSQESTHVSESSWTAFKCLFSWGLTADPQKNPHAYLPSPLAHNSSVLLFALPCQGRIRARGPYLLQGFSYPIHPTTPSPSSIIHPQQYFRKLISTVSLILWRPLLNLHFPKVFAVTRHPNSERSVALLSSLVLLVLTVCYILQFVPEVICKQSEVPYKMPLTDPNVEMDGPIKFLPWHQT